MSAKRSNISPQQGLVDAFVDHLQAQSSIRSMVAGESVTQLGNDAIVTPVASSVIKNWRVIASTLRAQPELASSPLPPAPPPPPPALPPQLGPWDTIVSFPTGVPVGGSASLTLFQDGSYAFNGHLHDSGAPSYNVELSWVVVSGSGRAYTFSGGGHLAGTFEAGSRNANWTIQGKNDDLAAHWGELTNSWTWRWSATVNWDGKAAVDSVVNALKTAGTVIVTVVAIVG